MEENLEFSKIEVGNFLSLMAYNTGNWVDHILNINVFDAENMKEK